MFDHALHQRFQDTLFAEAGRRKGRTCQEWIEAERKAMLDLVNRERTYRGKSLLMGADVERVENMAVGHCDYVSKFALYCTELVTDRP